MIVLCTRAITHHCIGGMPEVVWYQAQHFARNGYEVHVLTTPLADGRREFDDSNVHVHCLGDVSLKYSAAFYNATEDWLRAHKSEIACVISHSRAGTRGLNVGLPTVFVSHGTNIDKLPFAIHDHIFGRKTESQCIDCLRGIIRDTWTGTIPNLGSASAQWLSRFAAVVCQSPTHEMLMRQWVGIGNTITISNFVPDAVTSAGAPDVDATFVAKNLSASHKNITYIAQSIHDAGYSIRFVGKCPPLRGPGVDCVPLCPPIEVGEWIHRGKVFVDPSVHFSGLNTTLLWACCQERASVAYDLPGTDFVMPRERRAPAGHDLLPYFQQSLKGWEKEGQAARIVYDRSFRPSVWLQRWEHLFRQIKVNPKGSRGGL